MIILITAGAQLCPVCTKVCLTSNVVNMTLRGVEKRCGIIWLVVVWPFILAGIPGGNSGLCGTQRKIGPRGISDVEGLIK